MHYHSHTVHSPPDTPQCQWRRQVDEERGHLIDGVWNHRVGPEHYRTEDGPIWEAKDDRKEESTDRVSKRQPEVNEDEEVGEVAKVKQEIVPAEFLVCVPAVGEENNGFLWE